MRILIVSQYFPPEPVRVGDVARGLRELGHDVTVLTGFPNYPHGKLYEGYRLKVFQREVRDGIAVIRVPVYPDHSYSSPRRLANYASFVASASLLGPWLVGGFDRLLVFQTSPVSMAVPAVFLRKLRRRPLVLWVQDIWPDTLAASGIAVPPGVLRAVAWLARAVYRNCDLVLVQSRGFVARLIEQGVPPRRIAYLPNWAEETYRVVNYDAEFARQEGLDTSFSILFAGNIGIAQNLEVTLRAAHLLRAMPEIKFVVVGDGAMLSRMVRLAGELDLPNVVFKGRRPEEQMPKFFAAADGLLVQLKKDPLFALTVPGKLQAYMACGRPIIAAVEGSAAEVVSESKGGLVCPPDDPEALRDAILKLRGMDKKGRGEIGENARRYYEEHFDRRRLLSQLDRFLTA